MLAWKYLFARRWSIFFYFTMKQYNARFDWYLIKNDGEKKNIIKCTIILLYR